MSEKTQDAATDLLIQEVDEELRHEQLNKVWKKYGGLLVGVAVALVAGVAGWQAYHAWQNNARQTASAEMTVALQALEQGKTEEAAKGLAKLTLDAPAGYRQLAQLKQADLKIKTGDLAAGMATYDQVAGNSSNDPLLRDLARLKAAYLKLDQGDATQAERDVQSLSTDSSPWRHSAREIMALSALKRGDTAKAMEWFGKVSDDGGAPTAIRTRATEMLAALSAKPAQ